MIQLPKEFHTTEIKDMPEGDIVRLDFRWVMEKGKVTDFAINVSLLDDEKLVDVFRVDTKHGYLHEQRFWINPEPIKMPKSLPLQYIFNFYLEQIKENFERYKQYYLNKLNGE